MGEFFKCHLIMMVVLVIGKQSSLLISRFLVQIKIVCSISKKHVQVNEFLIANQLSFTHFNFPIIEVRNRNEAWYVDNFIVRFVTYLEVIENKPY